MSVELDWTQLLHDTALSATLLGAINRALAGAKKPAFVGDIVASALDFGSEKPDVEVVHVGDIDTLFLDRTDHARAVAAAAHAPPAHDAGDIDDEDDEQALLEQHLAAGRRSRGVPANGPLAQHAKRGGTFANGHRRARQNGAGVGARAPNGGPMLGRPASSNLGSPLGSGSAVGLGYASGIHTPSGPAAFMPPQFSSWQPQAAIIAAAMRAQALDREAARHAPAPPTRQPSVADVRTRLPVSGFPSPLDEIDDPAKAPPPGNSATVAPSLQVHLRTRWRSSTVRCNIRTSLVINYPSPHFMSLDVNISLVGLVFDGVVILAIEGERRKMHISIMEHEGDEDDEGDDEGDGQAGSYPNGAGMNGYGPDSGQLARMSSPPPPRLGRSHTMAVLSHQLTGENGDLSFGPQGDSHSDTLPAPPPPQKPRPLLPPNPDLSPLASRQSLPAVDTQLSPSSNRSQNTNPYFPLHPPPPPLRTQSANAYLASSTSFFPHPIPTTPGARLLPSLTFESSVGEADRHVLRNVGKVEKFVQDMVRKVVEDQLLFPNFKTVDLRKNQSKK